VLCACDGCVCVCVCDEASACQGQLPKVANSQKDTFLIWYSALIVNSF
jgi:hypothetical protein